MGVLWGVWKSQSKAEVNHEAVAACGVPRLASRVRLL